MKKIFFVLLCLVFLTCGCSVKPEVVKEKKVIDSINFKVEYEKYNDSNYFLQIDNDNPFKYLTVDNFEDVFSSNSIIYIGNPDSNLSRYLVDSIIGLSNNYKNCNIYYLNLNNNLPEYKVISEEVNKTKNGTDLYNMIVNKLDEYLSLLTIESNNKLYKTNDKIFTDPTLVFIKDGKVIGFYDEFEFNKENEKFVLDDLYLSLVKENLSKIYNY